MCLNNLDMRCAQTTTEENKKILAQYGYIAFSNVGIHADQKIWSGETTCEQCGEDIAQPYTGNNFLYDAKTLFGPWAVMCQVCWQEVGNANHLLGTGFGQQYLLMKDMKFHKITG